MIHKLTYLLLLSLLIACSKPIGVVEEEINEAAPIFPDYADCTIPVNIAPLNFKLTIPYEDAQVIFTSSQNEWHVNAKKGQFSIPVSRWEKMLEENAGKSVSVKVIAKSAINGLGILPSSYT